MIKTYSQALDYIYSFVDFSISRNLRYSPEKFNLKRMEKFLDLMGNPHKKYPTIHVAGTKGKGSICAMLTSILSSSRYKAGFYSSPHMIKINERIRIGNKLITNHEIIASINYLSSIIQFIPELTTFEILTGMAFKYFADKQVDFAVIEVGMGGRFDATNVIDPLVSIISAISLDHTKILGNTIKKIAFEKSGIIKNDIPVIIAKQRKEAFEEIRKVAIEKNSKMIYVPENFQYTLIDHSLKNQKFRIMTKNGNSIGINLPLLGDHQVENALSVFAAIEELRKKGVLISDQAIKNGFKKVRWQGRFEVINNKPQIIIDGAHNLDSINKLKATIQKYFPEKKIILIFGASEDKKIISMLSALRLLIKVMIITKSDHPRAAETKTISEIAEKIGIKHIIREEIKDAIGEALIYADNFSIIVATGSIFIAGAVKENIKG